MLTHKYILFFYIFIIFSIITLGCTDNPPQILEVSWQINLCYDLISGHKYEKISIFVWADDEDGLDDLEALYLINDDEELYWTIDSESWEKSTNKDETWVGTNSFTMPDASIIPTGRYRVLLQDLAGNTVETSINIKAKNISPSNAPFPLAEIEDEKIIITSIFSNLEIWIYDSNAQFITNYPVKVKEIELNTLFKNQPALKGNIMFYLYAHDNTNDCGLISGPYYYTKPLEED